MVHERKDYMDWLKGMNAVVAHIEDNLTKPIPYQSLSQIVGCSVYEFSRIFSFMAGMSISEYIRRRRLSQAAFDIQASRDKIIDIALKYCYESPLKERTKWNLELKKNRALKSWAYRVTLKESLWTACLA
jgi:AraC-like DNA-binding protein